MVFNLGESENLGKSENLGFQAENHGFHYGPIHEWKSLAYHVIFDFHPNSVLNG